MTRSLSRPLIDVLVPMRSQLLCVLLQVLAGVIFLALLAQFQVSIGPVPITGQTLGVLLLGAAYGVGLGTLTLIAYLITGGLGLGVFAGGTAGYLGGFVLAAAVVGYLAQCGWDRKFTTTALAMLVGNALIYLPGLLWLSRFAPDWTTTLQWGLVPFIPGDLVKLLLATGLLPIAWALLGRKKL